MVYNIAMVKTVKNYQVFVSGIPYTCTQADIEQFFKGISCSEVKLPKYQDTGRCLGYAHVTFDSQEDIDKAKAKSGQHLQGRYLKITDAKGEKQVLSAQIPVGCKVVFVKNLPYQITEDEIREQFQMCGSVEDVRMVRNWANKKFKGFAYVEFKETGSVKKAVSKFHGRMFRGRKLIIDGVITQMKKGYKKRDQEIVIDDRIKNDQKQEEIQDEIQEE